MGDLSAPRPSANLPNIHALSSVVRSAEQVSADVGGEAVILQLENEEYYGLSNVGARVWQLLAQRVTVGEIQNVLVHEYGVDPERCGRDLLALLSDMAHEGLIDVSDESVA